MLERDNNIKLNILLFLTLLSTSFVFSQNIKLSVPEKQLKKTIVYINDRFDFASDKDKKLFLSNQLLWSKVIKTDCSLIYNDIGSHSAFLIHYNGCLSALRTKRITFLVDNYICKYSQMTGEKCVTPSELK